MIGSVWMHWFQANIRKMGRLGKVKVINFYHSPFFIYCFTFSSMGSTVFGIGKNV